MKITTKNRQIWKDLFDAAIAFRDQKSWTWLMDRDLFGVKDPNSDMIGYCCIMGRLGEVYALGVYLGAKGYQSYRDLASAPERTELDQMAIMREQVMIKIEFVDNKEADKVDKAAYKALGLKFRGRNQYVQIRELLPSFLPWYITDEQAVFITYVLEQATEVTERAKTNPKLIATFDESLLVRIANKEGENLVWHDTYQDEPARDISAIERSLNPFLKRKVAGLKKEQAAICFSYFYIPNPVGNGKKRSFFAKVALWMLYGNGMIISQQVFEPDDSPEKLDAAFINCFEQLGIIPTQILINSDMAGIAATPIIEAFDLEMYLSPEEEEFGAIDMFLNDGFMG